jgi:predicted RND superfamily exporter protein
MTLRSLAGRLEFWIVLLVGVLTPFLMYGSWIALDHNANSVRDWLPENLEATRDYERFLKHFGTDEFVLISWVGCTLDDPRVDRLAELLQPSDPDGTSPRPTNYLRVITGQSLLRELTAPPVNLPREVAINRLIGIFVGPDRNQTCLLVELTSDARQDLHRTMSELQDSISIAGVPASDVKLGGSPVVNDAMDDISIRSMFRAIVFTCCVSIVTAWLCLRDARLTVLVLLTAILSMAASLAVLPLWGVSLNATLFVMVPMVQSAAVSGAIHLCNYYLQAVSESGLVGAARRAVKHAWTPLSLAAGTTAAGLLSTCYSDLQPIQQFGLYSAIGIGLSWLLLMFWLPSSFSLWSVGSDVRPSSASEIGETGEAPLPRFWQYVGGVIVLHNHWMLSGCCVLFLVCAPGLLWFKVTVELIHELPQESDVMQDFRWLEENLCDLATLEVIIRIPEDSPLSLWERTRLVQRIQERLAKVEDVGSVMSVATLLPEWKPRDLTLVRRPAIIRQLEKQRPKLIESRFLADGTSEELWRVALRIPLLQDFDFDEFTDRLRKQVEPELQTERFQGVTTTCTGVSVAIFKSRRTLVNGLIWGLITDVLLIYLSVLVMMRSFSGALMMIIASIFPTAIVLGIAGWLGMVVHSGTVMAPCVALGVTVDDVIHFLIWFRGGVARGMTRPESLQLAWRRCARPMYQSWALLGAGMLTLLLCDFTSMRQFGLTMAAMLTAGLIGNLVLVPALLAGPLGKYLCSRR